MFTRSLPGAALVAGALLAACRTDRPAAAAAASDTAPPTVAAASSPVVITVTASDFKFDAPAEVPAGLVTVRLVNQGPSIHHVQLLRLEQGKTAEEFVAAVKAGGMPQWVVPAGGPNPPPTGGTSSADVPLAPGQYVMVCFVPDTNGVPHMAKGMMRPLTVTAAGPTATAEPDADIVMKLVDFDFQLSTPLTAGHHVIRIENAGSQPHEVAIVRLEPGKDPLAFAKWGEHQVGPAPGTLQGGVSAIMPGSHAFVPVDLPPGEYGLLCFVPEAKDGKPHFIHGMAKRITIS